MTPNKKLVSYTASHVGLVRTKNDDSSYAGSYLTVIADGMGGHAGGDTASALTVLGLIHLDRKHPSQPEEAAENILIDNIHNANSLLGEMAAENPALTGMGTTVSAVLLIDDTLQFAHIGDSRAYRLSCHGFEQISRDHTYVQQLVDEGRLSPMEAAVHPNKNVVTRILGDVDASPEIDSRTYKAVPGERWLLCSDGLTDVVPLEAIAAHMQRQDSLKDIAETLIALTLEAGSPDNVTVAVFDVVPADSKTAHYSQTILVPELISSTLSCYPAAALPEEDLRHFSTDALNSGYNPQSALATLYLQEQLQTRPHILAGAASLAMEQADVPATQKFLDHLQAQQPQSTNNQEGAEITPPADGDINSDPSSAGGSITNDTPPEKDSSETKHKNFFSRRFYTILTLMIILIISATGFLAYSWIQTQYYVGVEDNKVAIFRGVPQHLGPISFSSLERTTNISLDDLDDHGKTSVSNTIVTSSKEAAEQIVLDLPRKKFQQSFRSRDFKASMFSPSRLP